VSFDLITEKTISMILSFAKRRFLQFNGLADETFYFYLKECEFRFNNRKTNIYDIHLLPKEDFYKLWGKILSKVHQTLYIYKQHVECSPVNKNFTTLNMLYAKNKWLCKLLYMATLPTFVYRIVKINYFLVLFFFWV